MITKIFKRKDIIEQLESIKAHAESMAEIEGNDIKVFKKDVIALEAAIKCIESKRKEDVYIIKATICLTLAILFLIFIFWNLA
jgi:hypothetical protein